MIATLIATLLIGQTKNDPLLGSLAMPMQGRSMRETSTFRGGADGKYDRNARPTGDLLEHSNRDNFRVAPGATQVLMDRKGPGVITHMWFTFLGPEPQDWAKEGSANHQEMLLRIYYDGNPKPAVEAPVGDFFANCFGKRSQVISVPVVVEDADSYNCFWRMPFHKSAKIEIVNQSSKSINLLYYNIDWIKLDTLPKDTPYFYAQYRQEYPVEHGKDYTVLETTGKGHYVGTVLAVRSRSPSWFGEGDEKIYIDGEKEPSIWGTGTEDYFLSAWGLQTTSTPYAGTPYFDQWGIVGGHTSAYRWHLNDPLVFQKGIKVTLEHWGWIGADENKENRAMSWNEREDDFSSVAFWYQQGPSTFTARAPENRKLPNIERLVVSAKTADHGVGNIEQQQLDFYDGPQTLYMPQSQTGAWIEVPFEIKVKEPLRLVLNMTTSYDFGTYQPYLVYGGKEVKLGGPIDTYSEKVLNREFHLMDFWPAPGSYILRLKCTGKNPKSAGFLLGIESIRLRERRPRVKEMGWDKDMDWTVKPVLYG
ncbi:MAG: glycoside hydrolase family 172 protein [Fimbriimonadaceae bacterium]